MPPWLTMLDQAMPWASWLRIRHGRRAGGSAGVGVPATGDGASPTSGGTGGGASPPSRAGSETIPAIAAATIAATFPTLAHLICLPDTSG